MLMSTDELSKRLWRARKNKNMSREQLARKLEISANSLYNYEKGIQVPTANVLKKIAEALNVSTDYLLGNTDDPTPPPQKTAFERAKKQFKNYLDNAKVVPLFDGAHAGDVGYFLDNSNAVGTFLVPCDKTRGINPDFVVEIHGDSMEPEIPDGSLVAVQKNVEIKNGDMVVVTYDDGALVKKIFFQDKYFHFLNFAEPFLNIT
jgi:phage repressor protein C with HTH and peptisase S24 domain